jgi:hypothetical protein
MRGKIRQIILVIAVLANIVVNNFGVQLGLYPVETRDTSASVPNSLVPFDFTFIVWAFIFLGILAFAIFQARPTALGARYDALAIPFLLLNLFNTAWPPIWNNRLFGWSVVMILGDLLTLIWLYLILNKMQLSRPEWWCLKLPTSLFLAWITVATAVNTTVWLTALGWQSPLSATTWASILVLVVAVVGTFIVWRTGDIPFVLVLLWAFYGIYAKRPEVTILAVTLLTAGLVLVVATLLRFYRPPRNLARA